MRDSLATHASEGLHSFISSAVRRNGLCLPSVTVPFAHSRLTPMGAEIHVVLFLDLRVHCCIRVVRQLQPVGPHHGENIRWEQKLSTFIKYRADVS